MPIKDLTGRYRPQRLGKVRLGRTKEKKIKGKIIHIPYATSFFVLDSMPDEVKAIYGEEPTTLRIHFLFNSIHDIFPHYHKYYLRRGLRCLGDGEIVLYRAGGTVEESIVFIRGAAMTEHANEEVLAKWAEFYGTEERLGNSVTCLGFDCPVSQQRDCRPTGRLCFALQDYDALGYFEMRTGSINAISGIVGQLELGMAMFGHISDIPWNLHLRPETVQVEGKGMKIYVPWIEIASEWLQQNLRKRGLHLRAAEEERMGDIADLYGEQDVEPLDHERLPAALLEEAKEVVEEPQQEDAKEPEDTEALWAYAMSKGLATGIVQTVLEETGGAIEETLARLKKLYGEVDT